MRVPSNAITQTLTLQLQKLSAQQAEVQNQLVTLKRIRNLSDDPSASAEVLGMTKERVQLQQYYSNNGRALEVSKATFSGMDAMKKLLDRAGELAALGGGVSSADSNRAYGAEVDQLIEQALQTGNTRYGGEYIFGGVRSDAPPFEVTRGPDGKITSASYVGASTSASIRIAEDASISPYNDAASNADIADFINRLVALRDGLNSNSSSDIAAARSSFADSEEQFITTISGIGAIQSRLEISEQLNSDRFLDLTNLTSQKTDVDIASSSVKLMQTRAAYQAALESGSMLLKTSLLDYLR